MTTNRILSLLVCLILILAAVAAAAGLFWPSAGAPFNVQSVMGESVEITGSGLYFHDPLLGSVQQQAVDVVTLFIAVPVLAWALVLSNRGSLRGRLLLTGVLGFFVYNFTAMAFGLWFNALFLVYVALFGLSLFALFLAVGRIDIASLPERFSSAFPRRTLIGVAWAVAAFLSLAWLGRILPAQFAGTPPYGLLTYTTLFIQVLDLGVVAPLAALTGVLLLRRTPLGYLLAAVVIIKGASMGLALIAMILNEARTGMNPNLVETAVFSLLALAMLWTAGRTLAAVKE